MEVTAVSFFVNEQIQYRVSSLGWCYKKSSANYQIIAHTSPSAPATRTTEEKSCESKQTKAQLAPTNSVTREGKRENKFYTISVPLFPQSKINSYV